MEYIDYIISDGEEVDTIVRDLEAGLGLNDQNIWTSFFL